MLSPYIFGARRKKQKHALRTQDDVQMHGNIAYCTVHGLNEFMCAGSENVHYVLDQPMKQDPAVEGKMKLRLDSCHFTHHREEKHITKR